MSTRDKLAALRRLMAEHGLDAYLVPSTDPHMNEYVPDCWRRREWVSGFTGSAGDLLVLAKDAGLWTDGRYFLQAEEELKGSGIRLFRSGEPKVPSLLEFVEKALGGGKVLGVDPRVLSIDAARKLEAALRRSGGRLALPEDNLIDAIWLDRPMPSSEPIRVHDDKYAGETLRSKLGRVREQMKEKGVQAHVLTTLDAIAWLYNIRGRDVLYNPVAIACAIVTAKEAYLYIGAGVVPKDVGKKLGKHVRVRSYDAFDDDLRDLGARPLRVWIDGGNTSRWVADLLAGADLVTEPTPVALMKARKNTIEIEGMRAAHVRDGVAMVRFLRWLDEEVPKGAVTEISASDRLAEFRAEQEMFQSLSFSTISGYAEHGAVIHYSASERTNAPLRPEGLYLTDSGAQYLDGTTDVTRTVLLGRKPTREQREQFTRVLRGHIALARAKFPAGVRGIRLDTLARLPLWEAGLDYNHGTGHGVGAHLSVHEGPQSMSPTREGGASLEPGNILSNEPGFYQPGAYGIRIENLVLVAEDETLSAAGKPFLRFETITMCPIDLRMVSPKMLRPEEREWLNDYHRRVLKTLGLHLDRKERQWLSRACVAV